MDNSTINFTELYAAILCVSELDHCNTSFLAAEFARFTGQDIPEQAVSDFRFTGLSNVDFLTSDFLHKYGVKNLIEFINENKGRSGI